MTISAPPSLTDMLPTQGTRIQHHLETGHLGLITLVQTDVNLGSGSV
jgi:hypothetical protein